MHVIDKWSIGAANGAVTARRGFGRFWRGGIVAVLIGQGIVGAVHAAPGGLLDGTYDAFNCAAEISDTRIVLSGNEAAFYETVCQISNPQYLRGLAGATLLDAACEGEGQTWTTRFIMMQTRDGGLALMQEGWGDHYVRCD